MNTLTNDFVNDTVVSLPDPMSNTNMNTDAFPDPMLTTNPNINDFVNDFVVSLPDPTPYTSTRAKRNVFPFLKHRISQYASA